MADFRVGCYIRVSTDEQAKEGFSIAAQQRILDAWCVIKGASAVEYYIDDGYSAKNMRRPAMQRLLADCRAKRLNAVLVWKLDRLSRSLRDIVVAVDDIFIANNIQLISATESIDTATPSGRLMLNILGSFAQNERENTSQRVRMVMNDLAKQGNHMGGVPLYGYQIIDKKYVIHPREAEAVRMAFRMKAAGEGYGAIITALTAAGHFSRSGEPFKKNTLYDMLRNPRYKGLYVYNRIENYNRSGSRNNRRNKKESEIIRIENGCPGIVSESLWNSVNGLMENNVTLGGQCRAKFVYLLSGLVACGICESKMAVKNAGRNRSGGYYRVYKCPSCGQSINHVEADDLAVRFVADLAAEPQLVERAARIADSYAFAEADSVREALAPLYTRRADLRSKRDNIMAYIASLGASADPAFADQIRSITAQLRSVDTRIERLEHSVCRIDADQLRRRIQSLIDIRDLDPHAQRELLRHVIDQALIFPDRIDISLRASPPDTSRPNPDDPGSGSRRSGSTSNHTSGGSTPDRTSVSSVEEHAPGGSTPCRTSSESTEDYAPGGSPSRGSPPHESDIPNFFDQNQHDTFPASTTADHTGQPTCPEQLLPHTQAMSHHIQWLSGLTFSIPRH